MTWRELFERLIRVLWAIYAKRARDLDASLCRKQHEIHGSCHQCEEDRDGVTRYFTHCPHETAVQRRNVRANRKMIGLARQDVQV